MRVWDRVIVLAYNYITDYQYDKQLLRSSLNFILNKQKSTG